MNMNRRQKILGLLLAGLLPVAGLAAGNPCATPALSAISEGLGGTGRPLDEGLSGTGHAPGGIGGTGGRVADARAGGLGGTGHTRDGFGGTGDRVAGVRDGFGGTGHAAGLGGTGAPRRLVIRGMVTGFASVCVNGLEIHYDRDTPVRLDGRPATGTALAVGQIVDIEARLGTGGLRAQRLDVVHQLAGRIEQVDRSAGRIEVAGTPVHLPAGGFGASIDRLNPGEPVLVSGLRLPDGSLQATRVDPVDRLPPSLGGIDNGLPRGSRSVVQGVVEQADGDRVKLVGLPPVRLPQAVGVQPGELVTLVVDYEDDEPVGEALAEQTLDDLHEVVGHPEPVEIEDWSGQANDRQEGHLEDQPEHDIVGSEDQDVPAGAEGFAEPEHADIPEEVQIPEAPDIPELPDHGGNGDD